MVVIVEDFNFKKKNCDCHGAQGLIRVEFDLCFQESFPIQYVVGLTGAGTKLNFLGNMVGQIFND